MARIRVRDKQRWGDGNPDLAIGGEGGREVLSPKVIFGADT